jgi:hypothetical protein
MLLQPLLQLLVPVVQHLLDESADALQLPSTHRRVQNRVALVSFVSNLLMD